MLANHSAIALLAVILGGCATVAPPQTQPASQPVVFKMVKYHLVLLRRGPTWSPEMTAESRRIGEGHMANINKMAKTGKLLLAGPFLLPRDQTTALAGLFILDVETVEEAQAMLNEDPGVQAGRFTVEIVPWLGPDTLRRKVLP